MPIVESGESQWMFQVLEADHGKRLDLFVSEQHLAQNVSREKIKRAIREGRCQLDSVPCSKPNTPVKEGQVVTFSPLDANSALSIQNSVSSSADTLVVLYQDEYLAVIDKPAGLTVHPCPSCHEETLVHRLVARFPQLVESSLSGQDGLRPGIVHRLDKDTSGLMVVALTEACRLRMTEAFADRQVHKAYWALVKGVPQSVGSIDKPIARHPTLKTRMAVNDKGKPALSEWKVVYADQRKRFSLLKVTIHTGRTHQIRVHMAHLGHPLWGDKLYSMHTVADPFPRQMLHAGFLRFVHPFTQQQMAFRVPPHADLLDALCELNKTPLKVVVTGGAGCGKSALLDVYAEQQLPIWRADEAVSRLYEPGAEAWQMLKNRYGDRFVSEEKSPVDKQRLSEAMLHDADLKHEVESLVHALVRHELEAFWQKAAYHGAHMAVAEVPLWFETRWNDHSVAASDQDVVVVGVGCDASTRVKRLQETRNWSLERIAGVDAWQWPLEDKLQKCHLVLDNSGDRTVFKDVALESLHHLEQIHCARSADFKSALLAQIDLCD